MRRPGAATASVLVAAALVAGPAVRPLPAQSPLAARHDAERTRHDALHYDVWIRLADSGSRFEARVVTRWRLESGDPVRINLDGGYAIRSLELDGRPARYARRGDEILVELPDGAAGEVATRIEYAGSPPPFPRSRPGQPRQDDGLVQRGQGPTRRIFADNWPDRARKWLAAQDHPSDKATVAWTIEAPAALTVVANGALEGVEPAEGGLRRWRFSIPQPIPVYTMVIGAARLVTTPLGDAACEIRCVPVSVVTYPADSAWAVNGPFRRAGAMVAFFSRLIAPFPYPELRHVQSSTIFGGMENATVIFYDANAFTRRSLSEGTVAHETAHQWFGDAATERDWHHLWLSEGFATYGAALWNEHVAGDSALRATMAANAGGVIGSPATERPILDPAATDLMGLLNSNNYPKGAWVLHTLRGLVGDSAFFRGLRRYYAAFEHGTALSSDFAAIMSEEAGGDLTWYFEQALTRPGHPVLAVDVRTGGGEAVVTLTQVQTPEWGTFRMPNLEIEAGGRIVPAPMASRKTRVAVPWSGAGTPRVVVDPRGWWLLDVKAAGAR